MYKHLALTKVNVHGAVLTDYKWTLMPDVQKITGMDLATNNTARSMLVAFMLQILSDLNCDLIIPFALQVYASHMEGV